MAVRVRKTCINKIFILAVMLILVAGLCSCGEKDNVADVSPDGDYEVLSVDSVGGNGIDYGKYEISGGSYNDDGANENGANNAGFGNNGENSGDNKGSDGSSSAGNNGKNSGDNKGSDGSSSAGNNGKNSSDKNKGNGGNGKGRDSKNQYDNNQTQENNNKSDSTDGKSQDSGVPAPSEPQDVVIDESKLYKCSLLVECRAILSDIEKLDSKKRELVPEDGIILEKKDIGFYDGESAFDVLLRETGNEKIHMEYSFTPIYNSSYIEGIANIYEFDCGELSGWVYSVNGLSPGYGISKYSLKDGDVIHVEYTLERK